MTLLLTLDAGSGDLVLPRRGTIPVVRETAKSTVQESIDWRDPKHMVLMNRYEGENCWPLLPLMQQAPTLLAKSCHDGYTPLARAHVYDQLPHLLCIPLQA